MRNVHCEAVILAGGLSRRMGQDKARVRLGGKSLLAHARAAARAAGLHPRVIRRDLIAPCGPLSGIYTALRTTSAEGVLFLSCDMPLVTGPLLEEVLSVFRLGANAVFTTTDKAGFPFALKKSLLPVVEERIAARQLSLQSLAAATSSKLVRIPELRAQLLFNINTPADYADARKLWATMNRRRPSRFE
jgi:molybdopterin-guanine dinucleotide biosynthesis protein A